MAANSDSEHDIVQLVRNELKEAFKYRDIERFAKFYDGKPTYVKYNVLYFEGAFDFLSKLADYFASEPVNKSAYLRFLKHRFFLIPDCIIDTKLVSNPNFMRLLRIVRKQDFIDTILDEDIPVAEKEHLLNKMVVAYGGLDTIDALEDVEYKFSQLLFQISTLSPEFTKKVTNVLDPRKVKLNISAIRYRTAAEFFTFVDFLDNVLHFPVQYTNVPKIAREEVLAMAANGERAKGYIGRVQKPETSEDIAKRSKSYVHKADGPKRRLEAAAAASAPSDADEDEE